VKQLLRWLAVYTLLHLKDHRIVVTVLTRLCQFWSLSLAETAKLQSELNYLTWQICSSEQSMLGEAIVAELVQGLEGEKEAEMWRLLAESEDPVGLIKVANRIARLLDYKYARLVLAATIYARSDSSVVSGLKEVSVEATDLRWVDQALDASTMYGIKYLQRTGNWSLQWRPKWHAPYPEEAAYLDKQLGVGETEGGGVEVTYRAYQRELIEATVAALTARGWANLIMPCGTGKTITGFGVWHEFIGGKEDAVTLVVTPFIQIVEQFVKVWHNLARSKEISVFMHVLASVYLPNCFHLPSVADLYRLTKGQHLVFTTYMSVAGIDWARVPNLALVVYDEAHHMSRPPKCRWLGLTATPAWSHKDDIVLPLQVAWELGVLVPFSVIVVSAEPSEAWKLIRILAKRTILFATQHRVLDEIFGQLEESESEIAGKWLVGANTPIKERAKIYREFVTREHTLLGNCNILSEGTDLPACDSVWFGGVGGFTSHTKLMQAIGRALRPTAGKTHAWAFISNNETLSKRLTALQAYIPTRNGPA
jgi:hypothetical protein